MISYGYSSQYGNRPADGNVTAVAKNEVFGIINFAATYYEKSASRSAFPLNKQFRAEFTESK